MADAFLFSRTTDGRRHEFMSQAGDGEKFLFSPLAYMASALRALLWIDEEFILLDTTAIPESSLMKLKIIICMLDIFCVDSLEHYSQLDSPLQISGLFHLVLQEVKCKQ
jgi:hypothetical protein